MLPEPIHIIACGALAREIKAVIDLNRFGHVKLRCLPAILHNTPDKITAAVSEALDALPPGEQAFVAYADCGTGGQLAALCEARGVPMFAGPHCYALFETRLAFAAHEDEIGAFYLTDFIARQFDAFVWRPLGLDRHPELREMYFAHYDKLVYLAQTEDAALTAAAQEAADKLGLPLEIRPTGLGDLAGDLRQALTASG